MITEIYLVRHADSDYSSGDEETRALSDRGRIDAVTVTEVLFEERVQVICSSPYVRAIQTVEGIANMLGVTIDLDERFRERKFARSDYIITDPFEVMERGFIEPDFALPGGESIRDVELRGISAMKEILQKHSGKRVGIGIHGGIMTIIMHHYDSRFDFNFLRHLPKPDIYKLRFKNENLIGTQKIGTFGDKSILEST